METNAKVSELRENTKEEKEMETRQRYFVATMKGGHVRRSHYVVFWHYMKACSFEEAKEICKNLPRAKKDHKDFILEMKEITYEEYLEGRKKELNDPYLRCSNRQEQDLIYDQIESRIFPDPHYFEKIVREKRRCYNLEKKVMKSRKAYSKYIDPAGNWKREYAKAA